MTDIHLRSVRVALDETTRRLSRAGHQIHMLVCSYVPRLRLICTFAATSETQVRQDGPLGEVSAAVIIAVDSACARAAAARAHARSARPHDLRSKSTEALTALRGGVRVPFSEAAA
jgi:hypothetical protein